MAQISSGLESRAILDIMPLVPLGGGQPELARVVFAVNDAGNLVDALGANLDWVAQALTSGASGALGDDVRNRTRETVEVCRQLTRLLGGAIGSCRTVTRTVTPPAAPIQLSRFVDAAVAKISRMADSMGVLVLSEGPSELAVTLDPELMSTVLDALLVRAVQCSPPSGVVRIAHARCGSHGVIGLTSEGQGLSRPQLEQLYSASVVANAECASISLTSEPLRTISTMLFEQGGYIDVEDRPDGGTTLFVVVPTSAEIIEDSVNSGTMLAQGIASPRQHEPVLGQKRSEKMIVNSDRFGAIEVDATDVLTFPTGIIGFPKEGEFVLVRRADSHVIGWLQSTQTSYLTLPVVSAHALAPRFPDVPVEIYAERAGLGSDSEELAVLAVLSAPPGQPATVNLMAPIIVNAATRMGAQILIEGTRFSTRELFIFPDSGNLDLEHSATAMPSEAQAANSAAE